MSIDERLVNELTIYTCIRSSNQFWVLLLGIHFFHPYSPPDTERVAYYPAPWYGCIYGTGHAACIQAYKDNNEPTNNCYFAQNLFDFVKTRTFSIHQKYDSWAIPHVLGLQPDVDNLHADIDPDKRIALYGKEVVDHTINRHMNPRREGHNGFFMTSYYSHCNGRETAKIDGYTALEAFQEWYKFLDQRNPTGT